MSAWHSPQSIFNLGHRAVRELFTVPVQVQEKVDGSFFAFGYFPEYPGEELKIRSKGAVMIVDAPQDMFKLAAKTVIARKDLLKPGWQYRGETLAKPKHNSLSYDRTPKDNIILFDVLIDEESYLPYEELCAEAKRLDLEVVPQLFTGRVENAEQLRAYLEVISVLGGQKIEGVVVKPLDPLYGPDKKMLFGKFVSEAFKEVHRQSWKAENQTSGDILEKLAAKYGTQSRWNKAIIHLKEAGLLEDSPRDIGAILKEIPVDVEKECVDEIKEDLYKWAWPHLRRLVTRQFPEYYKERLLTQQFENSPESGAVTEG